MLPFRSFCTIFLPSVIVVALPSPRARPQTNHAAPSGLRHHRPRSGDDPISLEEISFSHYKIFLDASSTLPPLKSDGEYAIRLHWQDLVKFIVSSSREYLAHTSNSPPDESTSHEVNAAVSGDGPSVPPRMKSNANQGRRPSGRTATPQSVLNYNRVGEGSSYPGSNDGSPLSPGSVYQPGTYPTPDLLKSPGSKFVLLSDPASYTSDTIQQALNSLGPYSVLYLPPRTRWAVKETIYLQPHQELATMGYPEDGKEIAWLEAEESCDGHMLSGANKPGVRIRNIGFDGGMEKYGPSKDREAMIKLGDLRGLDQVIDRCILRHPRGWSCLQVFEGGEDVRITNNRVGPAGYDEHVMGEGYWADGISYAGLNGLVAGNSVTDTTDGGIVIFGAPGTLVTSNTVVTRTRMASGAINLVDHLPYGGNYVGTSVVHNTIRMEGSFLGIGVAQGPSVWWLPKPNEAPVYNHGAVVRFNLITAAPNTTSSVGYGFAASDVDNWICTDNEVSTNVVFTGDTSRMPREPRLASIPSGPFVRSPSRAGSGPTRSILQAEFAEGPVHYLLGIRPGEPAYRTFLPGQLALALGEAVVLKRVKLSFDADGEVRVSSLGDAGETVLWEAGCRDLGRMEEGSKLSFDPLGNLGIVSGGGQMLCPLTPRLQPGIPDLVLELSSERPHLFIASSDTGSVYWSPMSYEVGHQWQAKEGSFVCLTTPDSRTVFLSGMNPLGQYVILRSVGDVVVPSALPWPVSQEQWQVDWKSHDVDDDQPDHESYVFFQDDGNLVIYSGTTGLPLWATASDESPSPVTHLRWSLEPVDGLTVSCLSRDGTVTWKSGTNGTESQHADFISP
ncbi:hypothetical protein FRC01_002011 [Tulasnella sp. 417]|nr:hypothetical protein FRC01_002011 [Tulasnella sp. 417]